MNASGVPSGDVRARVLDFGLAKTMAVGLEGDLTQRPSGSLEGTEEGRILDTPAYMSPEQARGQAVDKGTDIWARGKRSVLDTLNRPHANVLAGSHGSDRLGVQ